MQMFSQNFTFLSEKNIHFNKHLQLFKCDQIPHEQMSWYINIVLANIFPTKLQNIFFYNTIYNNVQICLMVIIMFFRYNK